jgi:hypothetical protein
LKYKSPLEILYQRKIIIDDLRVFGYTCYVHDNTKKDKLVTRDFKIIFLGYSFQKKGYNCFDHANKFFYTSRDVTFLKNEPYFEKQNNNQESIAELTFGHHSPSLYSEPEKLRSNSNPNRDRNRD